MTSLFPPRGEFGSDIPAGDGKLANLFFTVHRLAESIPWNRFLDSLKGFGLLIQEHQQRESFFQFKHKFTYVHEEQSNKTPL